MRVEIGYYDSTAGTDGEGNYTSKKIPYIVFDAESEDAALTGVRESAPQSHSGLIIDDIVIDEDIGGGTYKVSANYKALGDGDTSDSDQDPEPVYAFETGGVSTHIAHSLKTIARYPATAIDYEGMINVDSDGTVNGLDVNMPCFNFTETYYFSDAKVTTGYKMTLALMTNKINDSAFRGYSAGSVMFMGVSGSKRGKKASDRWELTFKFAVQMNRYNFKVGDITVAEKIGWDHLWTAYKPEPFNITVEGQPVKVARTKAVGVYIERVFNVVDFGMLGIGS